MAATHEFETQIEADGEEVAATIVFDYTPPSPQCDDCPAWGAEVGVISVTGDAGMISNYDEIIVEELCQNHVEHIEQKYIDDEAEHRYEAMKEARRL